jgi:UDP-glucose 6-dehydrogenase
MRVGILGFGIVGRATQAHLQNTICRGCLFYAADKNTAYQDHANSSSPDLGAEPLDALFICLPGTTGIHASWSTYMASAIKSSWFYQNLTPKTQIYLRSTVPPGTADELAIMLPAFTVHSLPEFAQEHTLRFAKRCQFDVIGVAPSQFGQDFPWPFDCGNAETCIIRVTDRKTAEFLKLTDNLMRATLVNLTNEIVQTAGHIGLDVQEVESAICDTRWRTPTYSGWAYGGKCLPKDVNLWSYISKSNFAYNLSIDNLGRLHDTELDIQAAWKHYALGTERLTSVIGLENGPGSRDVLNSPAQIFLRRHYSTKNFDVVDSTENVDKMKEWIVNEPPWRVSCLQNSADTVPYLGTEVNVIVLAQRAPDKVHAQFKLLLDVLKKSEQEIKLVFNPSNGFLTEDQYVQCIQWGAVFIDKQEIDNF